MATTNEPAIAVWRGLLRVLAGPDEADMIWDARRHRAFSWSTGEAGRDTEARVFHATAGVGEYLRFINDVHSDPALLAAFDKIRRRQGFTRAEVWHQTWRGEEVVISLWEAQDLTAAMREVQAQRTQLDERIVEIRRLAFGETRVADNGPNSYWTGGRRERTTVVREAGAHRHLLRRVTARVRRLDRLLAPR